MAGESSYKAIFAEGWGETAKSRRGASATEIGGLSPISVSTLEPGRNLWPRQMVA